MMKQRHRKEADDILAAPMPQSYEEYAMMVDRHAKELSGAIADPASGAEFCEEMFRAELEAHKFGYTGDLEAALYEMGYSINGVRLNHNLLEGLRRALKNYKAYSPMYADKLTDPAPFSEYPYSMEEAERIANELMGTGDCPSRLFGENRKTEGGAVLTVDYFRSDMGLEHIEVELFGDSGDFVRYSSYLTGEGAINDIPCLAEITWKAFMKTESGFSINAEKTREAAERLDCRADEILEGYVRSDGRKWDAEALTYLLELIGMERRIDDASEVLRMTTGHELDELIAAILKTTRRKNG